MSELENTNPRTLRLEPVPTAAEQPSTAGAKQSDADFEGTSNAPQGMDLDDARRPFDAEQQSRENAASEAATQLEVLTQRLARIETELAAEQQERSRLQMLVESRDRDLGQARDEMVAMRHELSVHRSRTEALNREVGNLRSARERQAVQLDRLSTDRKDFEREIRALKDEKHGLEKAAVELHAEHNALQTAMGQSEQERRALLRELEATRSQSRTTLASFEESTRVLRTENEGLRARLGVATNHLDDEVKQAYSLRSSVQRLKSDLGGARRVIATLTSETRALGGWLHKEERSVRSLRDSCAEMQASLSTAIQEQIKATAHRIWLEEGRPLGRADEHWARASVEVLGTSDEKRPTSV